MNTKLTKKRKRFLFFLGLIVSTTLASTQHAHAQTIYLTNADYLAASTEELFDEAMDIIVSGDKEGLQQFMSEHRFPEAFILKRNLEVYVLKVELSRVCIRFKGTAVTAWVSIEAIRPSSRRSR